MACGADGHGTIQAAGTCDSVLDEWMTALLIGVVHPEVVIVDDEHSGIGRETQQLTRTNGARELECFFPSTPLVWARVESIRDASERPQLSTRGVKG